jgi:hypothetical protein
MRPWMRRPAASCCCYMYALRSGADSRRMMQLLQRSSTLMLLPATPGARLLAALLWTQQVAFKPGESGYAPASLLHAGERGSGLRARRMALSMDGGTTFARQWMEWQLLDPNVEGATIRIDDRINGSNRKLLFPHPSRTHRRSNLSIFSSSGGRSGSWRLVKVVDPGPAAYSALAILPNRSVAMVLYEQGGVDSIQEPCQGHYPVLANAQVCC